MIELQLDDTYKLTSDKLNWILEKYESVIDLKTKQPTGKYAWKQLGYFGTNLSHALKYYVNESVRDMDKVNVQQILDKLNHIDKHIDRIVKRENIKIIVKEKDKDNDE